MPLTNRSSNLNMPESTIPFSGFYETIHHHAIMDRYDVGDGINVDEGEGKERYEEYLKNYKDEEIAYCKEYVKNFSKLIDIPLTYVTMTSPREYNFMTNRIFVEINEENVKMLKQKVDPIAMAIFVKD